LHFFVIALASLHFDSPDPAKLYTSEKLRDILNRWSAMDVHHEKDDAPKADLTKNVAGHEIAAWNQGRRTLSILQMLIPPFQRISDLRFPTNNGSIKRGRSKKEKTTR
jgi:hypothetical protein